MYANEQYRRNKPVMFILGKMRPQHAILAICNKNLFHSKNIRPTGFLTFDCSRGIL